MEAPPDDDPLALLGIDLDSCPDVGSIASGSRRGRKRKLPHLASLVDEVGASGQSVPVAKTRRELKLEQLAAAREAKRIKRDMMPNSH